MSLSHDASRFAASGEMIPIPVMTTRRMYQPLTDVSVNMRYRVTDAADIFLHVVRDLNIELFFKGHNQLDQVERVCAKIINEACALNNLVTFYVEIFDYNFFNTLKNVRHGYLSDIV
mmetsp:Transcript_11231/g.13559  ORF Transcript_11231/g.13559 Transcript_11231/m.13559 type:complete len:117 (+) Transcript_11231:416-766(+)